MPSLVDGAGRWTRDVTPSRSVYGQQYAIHRYRPRVEGLFARIERWINLSNPQDTFWRSISKERQHHDSGTARQPRAEIADPADPSRVFSWLICQSCDDRGNVISYEYKPEYSTAVDLSQINERNRTDTTRSANRYLKHVFYGNRTPYLPDLTGTAELPLPTGLVFRTRLRLWRNFDLLNPIPQDTEIPWNCRIDPFSTYRPTFEVRTYRLCRRALMFHHSRPEANVGLNCLVRPRRISNIQSLRMTRASRFIPYLVSATQTGATINSAGGYFLKSLPLLEFDYTTAQPLTKQFGMSIPRA